jgi:chromosome partitioning protein
MKIISVANNKGGTGKTTTAVNFAAWLSAMGHGTLLVDLDPQGNATSATMDPTKADPNRGIGPLLEGEISTKEAIYETGYLPKLHIIPATIGLEVTELNLTRGDGSYTGGVRLKDRLAELDSHSYEYVVCDCPPNFGVMTTNGLYASSQVLITMEPETFALDGLEMFMTKITPRIRKEVNKNIKILGIVLVRVNTLRILTQNIRLEVRRRYQTLLAETEIPVDVRLPESEGLHLPVCVTDRYSRAALAYENLTTELLKRLG